MFNFLTLLFKSPNTRPNFQTTPDKFTQQTGPHKNLKQRSHKKDHERITIKSIY